MKTFSAKPSDIKKKWVVIDAKGQPLGRVATKAASILRGKTKPIYTPHMDTGDNVIIINAAQIKLTGAKWTDKLYHHHSGYVGGLRTLTAQQVLERNPAELLHAAIHGMLPKNRLSQKIQTNCRIFRDDRHPHASQKPETVSVF